MYVFGGISIWQNTGNSSELNYEQCNDIWRLQLQSNASSWHLDHVGKSEAPSNRSEASAITYKDQMILFGGISYDTKQESRVPQDYNDLWSFDFKSKNWTQLEIFGNRKPISRFSHSTSVITG